MRPAVMGLVMLALAASVAPRSLAADAGAPPPPAIPACIAVATESRYVPYGYNHIVRLKSSCEKPVTCTVSTDVNPEKQTVAVAPASTVEVTTFMGAASQTFVARVSCTSPK